MSSGNFHSRAKQTKMNTGDHSTAQCNHKINERYIHYKPARAVEGKETVKTYGNDGTRELIVPNRKPAELPGIFSKTEFQRLKNQARVVTKLARMEMMEEENRNKAKLLQESEKRKDLFQKIQLQQKAKQGSKLGDVENEALQKNQYVLQRAFELRQEQEDEVKRANGIILASKCLAIREAQITEKELVKKEMEEEDRRLDAMMEQKRQTEIKLEEKRRKGREESNKRFVKEISHQIEENELLRLVEAERKEEESRNINKALIATQREEAQKIYNKRIVQRKMREELDKANEDMKRYKRIQDEEQRIADLRIQEFMRKKAEREAAREAELEAERAAKERETALLRAQQEKAQGQQAAQEELTALRIQEEVEREWREKELLAAKKRKEQLASLRQARELQIEDLRKWQAMEIERDESEFHQVAKVQREQYERDMEKKRQIREAAVRHRKELLKQINEKEKDRLLLRKENFEMGGALRLEKEVRELKIKEVLNKKLEKLREKLPEQYVRDVERQLKLD